METAQSIPAAEGAPTPARAEATLYLLFARFFSYPSESVYRILCDERLEEELLTLLEELPFDVKFEGLPRPSASREELETIYVRAFDLGSPYVPCPLYEGDYASGGSTRMELLEEILRFYEHFDVKPNDGERDYPDHLVAELEFMAFLAGKEADAIERGTNAEGYRLALCDFLERHLARWVVKFDARVEKRIAEPFYKAASAVLARFVRGHAEHLSSLKRKEGAS